jgi:hypothetical protein
MPDQAQQDEDEDEDDCPREYDTSDGNDTKQCGGDRASDEEFKGRAADWAARMPPESRWSGPKSNDAWQKQWAPYVQQAPAAGTGAGNSVGTGMGSAGGGNGGATASSFPQATSPTSGTTGG